MDYKKVIKILMADDRNADWDLVESYEELKSDLEKCVEHYEELRDDEEVEYFKGMLELLK